MNELPTEKRTKLKQLLLEGNSLRNAARMVGCAKNTAWRYHQLWEVKATCGCGKPAGHNGWCWFRWQYAPKRQGFFDDQWKARKDGALYEAVRNADAQSKTLGHVISMFVWASGWAGAIAHTKCTVCGATGRLWAPNKYWNHGGVRFDGRVVERRCVTEAEREQQRKFYEEKRQWRSAKETLREIKRHLRQSHSPRKASTPERSSHP